MAWTEGTDTNVGKLMNTSQLDSVHVHSRLVSTVLLTKMIAFSF